MRFLLLIALVFVCLIGCKHDSPPQPSPPTPPPPFQDTIGVSGVYLGYIVTEIFIPGIPPSFDTSLETVTAKMVSSNALLIQLNPTSSQLHRVDDTLFVDPGHTPEIFGSDISFYRHIGGYAYYAYYFKAADSLYLHYFSTSSNAHFDHSFSGKK